MWTRSKLVRVLLDRKKGDSSRIEGRARQHRNRIRPCCDAAILIADLVQEANGNFGGQICTGGIHLGRSTALRGWARTAGRSYAGCPNLGMSSDCKAGRFGEASMKGLFPTRPSLAYRADCPSTALLCAGAVVRAHTISDQSQLRLAEESLLNKHRSQRDSMHVDQCHEPDDEQECRHQPVRG